MLKHYRHSGKTLLPEALKNITAGSPGGNFTCQVNSDCGSPYCMAPADVNCWVCVQYRGSSFCSWFEPW